MHDYASNESMYDDSADREIDRADHLALMGARNMGSIIDLQPPPFLFENFIRDRSITVIVAPPHRGKTFLMLEMALCLDMELPLFGRFSPAPGKQPFFLGCDAPTWDYALQLRKLCIGHGIDADHRRMLEINGIWKAGPKITNPDFLANLNKWRSISGDSVLFIDSHRSVHSGNENDSTEMEQVWSNLKRLRDSGWCIIMSHHTSKPQEIVQTDVYSSRGSSVIAASADFIYTLYKPTREDTRVNIKCVKGRGASSESDPINNFYIESVESDEMEAGQPLYGIKLGGRLDDHTQKIRDALIAGPKTRAELAAVLTVGFASDVQRQRFVDNRLTEFRKLGEAEPIQRGLWAWRSE